MILDSFLDILTSVDHTWCRTTKLDEVLPDLGAVEHGVEGCYLVHPRWFDVADLCHLVHGGDGEPPSVLALCQVEDGDDSGLFVVCGVLSEDGFDAFVVFGGEVEMGLYGVIGGVDVLCVVI